MTIKQLTEIADGLLKPSNKKLDATLVQISANAANNLSVAEDGLMVSVPSVDLSSYYTSTQTDSAITAAIEQAQLSGGETNVDLSDYATKEDLSSYMTLVGAEESFQDLISNIPTLVQPNISAAIAGLVDGAPETFDTLKEISTWIETNGVDASDLAASISVKADKTELEGYATIAQIETKADTLHAHTISDVTGLESALENKLGLTSTATSATKLATPRTINGVNFDGTANITVSDSTKLPTTGGTINGDLTVTGSVTLNTVLPVSSGGTGVTTLADLKAALGVPQFIEITQEGYDSLGDIEKNDPLKLYFIVG